MANSSVKRTRVIRCWLEIELGDDDETTKSLEISSFSVTFRLDVIPQAEMVPALGKEIVSGKVADLSQVQEDQKATLKLTCSVNGGKVTEKIILQGRIGPLMVSDSSTIFSRQQSAKITLIHEAVQLMGLPALSYGYSNNESATLLTLSNNKRYDPLTKSTSFQNFPENMFEQNIREETGIANVILWPGTVVKTIFKLIAESEGTDVDIDSLVKTYDSANLTKLKTIGSIALAKHMYTTYKQAWLTSSSWAGATAILEFLYLHIVPFNTGFYIADTLSLLNTADKTIGPDDYLEVSEVTSPGIGPRVDGVILRTPVAGIPGTVYAYPPLTTADGEVDAGGNTVRVKDRYYHFREMPHWLDKVYIDQFGSSNSPVGKGKGNKGGISKKKPEETVDSYYNSIGASLAKYAFAELKSKNITASFKFDFRDDIMPGTVLKIKNDNKQGLQFIGTTLYGMVQSTTFRCSVLGDSPSLNTFVTVEAIRSEADNRDIDDGGYGLTEHPIYQKRWVGTNLYGELLGDGEPEHESPKSSKGRKTNNAGSGGSSPSTVGAGSGATGANVN